jgi:hypothetical protein
MYTANGITTEFPLPEGADGSAVILAPPGGGRTIRIKRDSGYTVQDGAVFFSAPLPRAWTLGFDLEEGEFVERNVCTVIYPDGSMKELDRDPWELLVETRAVLAEAKAVHVEAREATVKAVAEIKALAAAAAGDLEGRLLGYSARAEDAIKAAAGGAAGALGDELAGQVREIREARKAAERELEEFQQYAAAMRKDILSEFSKLRSTAEEKLRDWYAEIDCIRNEVQAALLKLSNAGETVQKDIAAGITQIDGRVKFLLQEETRSKTELQAAIDEAKQNFPAVLHGNRGDIIRQRRDATREGDAVV